MNSLTQTFISNYVEWDNAAAVDEQLLQSALSNIITEARQKWSQITFGDHDFVEYLAQHMPTALNPLATLEKLHTTDLYLAAATVAGQTAAVAAFDTEYRPAVLRAAQRLAKQGVQPDDTCQQLMEHLLLPRGDRPPALSLYCGQGPLTAYVKVASVRKALRLLEKYQQAPLQGDLDQVMQLADASDNPELATLKDKYRAEFKAAFQWALGELQSSERNLLRYHYLANLNSRQIGKLVGLNQSNVIRRMARIRATLLEQTRQRMMAELELADSDFDSILLLVQSQLDVSIERILNSTSEE